MKCKKCGMNIPDGATVCEECGTPVSNEQSQPVQAATETAVTATDKKKKTGLIIGIAAGVIVLAVAVILILLMIPQPTGPKPYETLIGKWTVGTGDSARTISFDKDGKFLLIKGENGTQTSGTYSVDKTEQHSDHDKTYYKITIQLDGKTYSKSLYDLNEDPDLLIAMPSTNDTFETLDEIESFYISDSELCATHMSEAMFTLMIDNVLHFKQ